MLAGLKTSRESVVRALGITMATTFAAVGAVFLLVPGGVLDVLNRVGAVFGMPASPTQAFTLFLALAVAYMYVVTVLAVQMARHPGARAYPWLLVQAKSATAVLCLILFLTQAQYLAYAANAVVDGFIAVSVWVLAVRGAPADVASRDVPASRKRASALSGRPTPQG